MTKDNQEGFAPIALEFNKYAKQCLPAPCTDGHAIIIEGTKADVIALVDLIRNKHEVAADYIGQVTYNSVDTIVHDCGGLSDDNQ